MCQSKSTVVHMGQNPDTCYGTRQVSRHKRLPAFENRYILLTSCENEYCNYGGIMVVLWGKGHFLPHLCERLHRIMPGGRRPALCNRVRPTKRTTDRPLSLKIPLTYSSSPHVTAAGPLGRVRGSGPLAGAPKISNICRGFATNFHSSNGPSTMRRQFFTR